MMQLLVVVGFDVAAGENFFEVLRKFGIDGHQVFEVSVLRTIFDHPDLPIALNNVGFNLARCFTIQQRRKCRGALQDFLANLRDTFWTERVRLARPAQRWLGFLPRLQDWLIRPLGGER